VVGVERRKVKAVFRLKFIRQLSAYFSYVHAPQSLTADVANIADFEPADERATAAR